MHAPLPRGITLAVTCLFGGVSLLAQGPTEASFLAKQAEHLAKFAKFAFDQGYPQQGRRIWQEVLKEYDTNHASTRAALGFKNVGTAWQEDENFDFPHADNPNGRSLDKVEKRWNATRKTVGLAHKKMAETLRAAGRSDRAKWHFARALRFLPEDAGLQAASGMKSFYGMTGSELEHQLFDRSKKMKEIVAVELKKSYAVTDMASTDQLVYLIRAGIPHQGYKTKNYKVWSNMSAGFIRELAQNLERSHSFCSQVFSGHDGFHPVGMRIQNVVFLSSEAQYKKTLRANNDQFKPDLLEFLVKHTAMCTIGQGASRAYLAGDPTDAVLRDLSIRWPVDAWGAMQCDALNEGLGHAVVAWFLGHITVYSMDMEKQSFTVTNRKPGEVLVPDVDSWAQMAIESAFRDRGAPLAKLPLVSAADFPTETRVRAWSFCDYLLRRDPRLLLELDNTRKLKTIPRVRGAFQKSTGVRIAMLEKEWRDFWTGATEVLLALRGHESPYGASSKDAPKWLSAFNKIRKQHQPRASGRAKTEVVWNAAWSVNCKQHGEYLTKNRKERGPGPEQTQRDSLDGASKKGEFFAQMALVSAKGSPLRVMKKWIHFPGYRDAILNPHLMQVGIYAEKGIAVIDVVRGVVPPLRSAGAGGGGRGGGVTRGLIMYPPQGATSVPGGLDVKLFGPELEAMLKDHNPGAKIGYPISLHSWNGTTGTECEVKVGETVIAGVVHRGSQGWNRRTSAPGMAVFYPLKPFRKGAKVKVTWTLSDGQKAAWTFSTK